MDAPEFDADWQTWAELETAAQIGDADRIVAALWSLDLHNYTGPGHQKPASWDRAFGLLLSLVEHAERDVHQMAWNRIFSVVWTQGLSYLRDRHDFVLQLLDRRTMGLLPVLRAQVQRMSKDAAAWHLLDIVGHVVILEDMYGSRGHAGMAAWLAERAQRDAAGEAAHLLYVGARMAWPAGRELLFAYLDHPDAHVRAAAARSIGKRYYERDELDEHAPPLPELVAHITDMELVRPGVAGPLFAPWATSDAEDFASEADVDLSAWFVHIVSHRAGPEPIFLPICNGIDFFAHELLADQPARVRELMDAGERALALEAATESDGFVDGMEPVLTELADDEDDDLCRQASWQLARNYRLVYPSGAARGFVAGYPQQDGSLVILCMQGSGVHEDYPRSATVHPPLGEGDRLGDATFDDAAAVAWIERLLPEAQRGKPVFDLPFERISVQSGDGALAGRYLAPDGHVAHFESGAIVDWRGDARSMRWHSVRILWKGPPGIWSPAAACMAGAPASG